MIAGGSFRNKMVAAAVIFAGGEAAGQRGSTQLKIFSVFRETVEKNMKFVYYVNIMQQI